MAMFSETRDIVAIIPARGGSKGVKFKNIVNIRGIPLIAYTIKQSLNTPSIVKTYVSTDSEPIAKVSREWGAEVIMRPSELSRDESPSEDALLHALDALKTLRGREPDIVVFLQATSPIRKRDDIARAIDQFLREGADSLFSASPVQGFIWRKNDEKWESITYDFRKRLRRQEVPLDVEENGSIYIFKPWVLQTFHNRLGGNISVYIQDYFELLQIDEMGDIEKAEMLINLLHSDPQYNF